MFVPKRLNFEPLDFYTLIKNKILLISIMNFFWFLQKQLINNHDGNYVSHSRVKNMINKKKILKSTDECLL